MATVFSSAGLVLALSEGSAQYVHRSAVSSLICVYSTEGYILILARHILMYVC